MTPEQRKRLETNERAFHFWSEEDKAAAERIGKEWFLYLDGHGVWSTSASATFYIPNVYQLRSDYKSTPAITGWPEGLDKRFKWFAMNESGYIFVHTHKPRQLRRVWTSVEYRRLDYMFPDIQCHTDWKNSLTERTE